jgi:hypothetical protein
MGFPFCALFWRNRGAFPGKHQLIAEVLMIAQAIWT